MTYRWIIFLCLLSTTHASTQLETGSFDDQVYGKDGVVLLYDMDSEEQLYLFIAASESYEDDDRINFWHLNCDYTEFCETRSEVDDAPTMLYSFRNEFWEAQPCRLYTEHAFEMFFKTKVSENCLNTRSLCSSVMNLTIADHHGKNHSDIRVLYEMYEDEGNAIEKEWEALTNEIQNDFIKRRTEFQMKLRNADERRKVLGQMMEEQHAEAYDNNEKQVQELVIDMSKQ